MTLSSARRRGRTQPAPLPDSHADDEHFMSTRALVIWTVSTLVSVIAGLGAGIPAGLAVAADSRSDALPIIVGILSGLAAAILAGLTVAGCLHALVRRR